MLAVAASTEAFELRSRIPGTPILLMGALTMPELDVAMQAGAEIGVSRPAFLAALLQRAGELGVRPRVHVKLDSGMGRLGEPDPDVVSRMLATAAEDERVELAALWTHFATADEKDDAYLREQLGRFIELAERERERHPGLRLHAANSAAALRGPEFHLDMVRCGVAIYGLDPFGEDAAAHGLEPAMSVHSYVADVKAFAPGQSAGYGRSWRADRDTLLAVIPIGYGDGVRRGLSNRFEVLVEGRRCRSAGTISMDNLTAELGPGADTEWGAPVVLLGSQGDEAVTAEEWARALGTINYEVTCGISPRVPRAYRR
jgi:alanine racemase